MDDNQFVHRYIPNSAPGIREEMLRISGFNNVDEIFEEIPKKLRFSGKLNIPKKSASEFEVEKRVRTLLTKNKTTNEMLSFLGAGCWPHYIPALCGEITGRSEFQTAYAGGDAADHGRYQTMFEYQSMMGDLLDMDVVSAPVYDGTTAAGDAFQVASRATGRKEALVPRTISPNTFATIKNYCDPWLEISFIENNPESGLMDINDLKSKLSKNTAAVFVENPSYLGFIEEQCDEISGLAHDNGSLLIAYINPISLGLLKPPGEYGADIACGEGQPLGLPQSYGAATMGIFACSDAEKYLEMVPSFLAGLTPTIVEGEFAFSWHTLWDRMVYSTRDKARSFTGTSSWLWGISAAVYLALMGSDGIRKLGEVNIQKTHYAIELFSQVAGLKAPYFSSSHFNEFVVNYDETEMTVEEINKLLFDEGILGGKDISKEFPNLGQSSLYCFTEVHSKQDIDRLVDTVSRIVK